jgi:hypothetical protein
MLLHKLCEVTDGIYEFSSDAGVDSEAIASTVKDYQGNLILFFDNSSELFFSINDVIKRYPSEKKNAKIIFILESRIIPWSRDSHRLSSFSEANLFPFEVPRLMPENANHLIDALRKTGSAARILGNMTPSEASSFICDKQVGYQGDLLATLIEVVTGNRLSRFVLDEYEEIDGEIAKKCYALISIVTAAQLNLPISYVCEIIGEGLSHVLEIIRDNLRGKVNLSSDKSLVAVRHATIATEFLHLIEDAGLIQDMFMDLMHCLSTKFTLADIPRRPLPFRIYQSIISRHFLADVLFGSRSDIIENIYRGCQGLFPNDGMYWIQYGRFLHGQYRMDEAEHCYRKGLGLYDSFHARHSLGQLLLQRYLMDGCRVKKDYDEGVKLLRDEIQQRGSSDPYPHTSLAQCLLNIANQCDYSLVVDLLRSVINDGMKNHRRNSAFAEVVSKFMSIYS